MTNDGAAILAYLLSKAALVTLVGNRVYAETDTPPAGYKPSDGGAICFKRRGGAPEYLSAISKPSVQFKCYAATASAANAVYRALYDAVNEGYGTAFKWALCQTYGVTLTEPETGWPFVLSYFEIWIAEA